MFDEMERIELQGDLVVGATETDIARQDVHLRLDWGTHRSERDQGISLFQHRAHGKFCELQDDGVIRRRQADQILVPRRLRQLLSRGVEPVSRRYKFLADLRSPLLSESLTVGD